MSGYRQLSLSDRKTIEEGLNEGKSFRELARLVGRDVGTISREVKANRTLKAAKSNKGACKDRGWCKRVDICEQCFYPGAYCVGCDKVDCRDVCKSYELHTRCDALTRAPWTCNACRKNRYGCNRPNRYVYIAEVADKTSKGRRSECRRGINIAGLDMNFIENTLRDALKRGLSPYEIAKLYADICHVSPSTLYRWVEAGVGGACNLDLERKCGFKERKGERPKRSTSHSKKRSYESFCALDQDIQDGAWEMDCVEGFGRNSKVLLTLYHRPSHLQIAVLLQEHTCDQVIEALGYIRDTCDKELFEKLFYAAITDNGHEFEQEDDLEKALFGHTDKVRLYYCDPRRSDQKAGCEKGHSELRQIIPKGRTDFDRLNPFDIAVMCSHANSSPRRSLCGLSPIDMFIAAYGDPGKSFLLALGIEKVDRDAITLKYEILNIERRKRGMDPLDEI
jgi:IS30 family transposase